ncbi:MAG: DUF4360 domain-containing protein [Bdellovibrionota bacterium]
MVKGKNLISAVATSVLAGALSASAYAFVDGPNPNEVYVNNIVHAGTGCPIGSVATDISEDAKAFTILFDEYVAEAGPGIERSAGRKFCQLTVNLHVPQGWSYTIFDVNYAGFADLDRGTYGIQKSTYYFQGNRASNGVTLSTRLRGPYSDDYEIRDSLGLDALIWSPCGVNRALNIKTSVMTQASRNQSALMTIDSIDGELIHRYGIKWKRCR